MCECASSRLRLHALALALTCACTYMRLRLHALALAPALERMSRCVCEREREWVCVIEDICMRFNVCVLALVCGRRLRLGEVHRK